jgi:phosphatidate cytidylyltransferase
LQFLSANSDTLTSALSKYNNLTQRIITGIIGAAVIITCISLNEWTYFSIFLIICFFSQLEFYKLIGLDGMAPQKSLGLISGLLIFVLSFLVEKNEISYRYYLLVYPVVTCVYMVKLYKKFERKPFTNIAFTFLGIFYVAVPFALLNVAVFHDGVYHYEIIFGCLFILWASDTGAYFAGTFFGKRKLFERISPKKSWEGFFGGAVLALIFTYGISQFFDLLSLVQWLVIGVIIIIGGTFGDLVESLLKRSIEIKDSGSSLPGHGGFLDRFDGLLLSAPFIATYLKLFQ